MIYFCVIYFCPLYCKVILQYWEMLLNYVFDNLLRSFLLLFRYWTSQTDLIFSSLWSSFSISVFFLYFLGDFLNSYLFVLLSFLNCLFLYFQLLRVLSPLFLFKMWLCSFLCILMIFKSFFSLCSLYMTNCFNPPVSHFGSFPQMSDNPGLSANV